MTEQTVSVPVELLKRIEEEVYYDSLSPLKELRAFIPAPPKVGDVVDTAEAAEELPAGTVLRDNVGDIWLVAPNSTLYYVSPTKSVPSTQFIDDPAFDCFKPVIISLPEESK